MAATPTGFLVDRKEIEFLFFEYLNLENLLSLPYFQEHNQQTILDMLSSVVDFCTKVLSPLNKVGDRIGCVHDKVTKKVTTPPGTKEAYAQYVEHGFLALSDPEAAGGLQVPNLVSWAFMEIFSSANQAFTMYPGLTKSASHVIWHYGEKWMRDTCVPKIVQGRWTGTMCLTEPSAGSAVGDLKTTAKRKEDGSFLIKGIKQWISGGDTDFSENVLHLVLARIEGAPSGIEGVSLFLVPKNRFKKDSGEVTIPNDVFCISLEEKMGIHGNATCLMSFGDKNETEGYLIGEENRGITYMFLMMNEARIGVGIQGCGQASSAFLNAENYAKERIQGASIDLKKDSQKEAKSIPIVNHPDVKRMLLRQRAVVEGSRALCYMTALFYDLSLHSQEEEKRQKYQNFLELLTPVAKAWSTDMGFESIVQSIQTYAGYGFTKDYPVEQALRDCKITSIYEGTNGIQALDFVGRKMRLQNGAVFSNWLGRHHSFIEKHKSHEALGKSCALLEEYLGLLVKAATRMGELGRDGDKKAAMLNSYPYMMAFGHIVVCGLLLEQAAVAFEKLKSAQLSQEDKRFYHNKMRTAKFFTFNILPEAKAKLACIVSGDLSCLEFEF